VTAADPFAGMPDDEVLKLAAVHLREAAAFALGSPQSAAERLRFRAAMAEFDRREAARVMRRLGEWRHEP
jgi:hypothetical protein